MIDQDLLFCGLFVGEGCIHLLRQKRTRGRVNYTIRLSVSQRLDNVDLLIWLRNQFGGQIVGRRHNHRGSWSATWQLATVKSVKRCLGILANSPLPSTKIAQARLALEFIATTRSPGRGHGKSAYTIDEHTARVAMYDQMHRLKQFDPATPLVSGKLQ